MINRRRILDYVNADISDERPPIMNLLSINKIFNAKKMLVSFNWTRLGGCVTFNEILF